MQTCTDMNDLYMKRPSEQLHRSLQEVNISTENFQNRSCCHQRIRGTEMLNMAKIYLQHKLGRHAYSSGVIGYWGPGVGALHFIGVAVPIRRGKGTAWDRGVAFTLLWSVEAGNAPGVLHVGPKACTPAGPACVFFRS